MRCPFYSSSKTQQVRHATLWSTLEEVLSEYYITVVLSRNRLLIEKITSKLVRHDQAKLPVFKKLGALWKWISIQEERNLIYEVRELIQFTHALDDSESFNLREWRNDKADYLKITERMTYLELKYPRIFLLESLYNLIRGLIV
jgi:hypothetical protein